MYEELQKASKPQPDGVFVGVESDKIEKYTKSIIGVMKAHEFIGLVPVIVLDQGLVKQALGSSEKTRLATPTDDEHKATNRILTQQIPLTSLDQATSLTAVAKRNAAELDRLAKAVAPYTATTPATSNLPRNTQRADMRTNTGFNPK